MIGDHTQDFRTIPALWPDVEDESVLDLGCGAGLYSTELARLGARCVGLDLSTENLRRAQQQTNGRRIHWVKGDATRLPFRTSCFKLVVSAEVVTHFAPDARRAALDEVHRVAVDGAAVFLSLHNRKRLSLSQWVRLRRSRPVYETSNLDVWPTSPAEAKVMSADCGLVYSSGLRYLNYHSRFTHRFLVRHPRAAKWLMRVEDIASRLPVVRGLAITFLLPLQNRSKKC